MTITWAMLVCQERVKKEDRERLFCPSRSSFVIRIRRRIKAFTGVLLGQIQQIDCLICLPDKSGNFLVFRAKTAQNTVKPEKTGFGMAITARLRPVFCVFGVKKLRTFYFKLTEQSSRKKLAVGGFEVFLSI